MADDKDKEKEEETEEGGDEKSEEEEEKSEDEKEEETEESSKKETEETREQKIKNRVAYARRKPEEIERLVGIEVDIEAMKSQHDETRRELNIERAMKKHGLDDDVQELITGNTREEIDTSAKKIKSLIEKSAGKKGDPDDKGDKKRHEKPDLKDADDFDETSDRDESAEAIEKRRKEAGKAMGFKR